MKKSNACAFILLGQWICACLALAGLVWKGINGWQSYFFAGLIVVQCIMIAMIYRLRFSLKSFLKKINLLWDGKNDAHPQAAVQPAEQTAPDVDKMKAHIKNYLEERREKETVLECLSEGVISIDEQMKIKYANRVGSKMLGMPKRHLIGKNFPKISSHGLTSLLDKCHSLLRACLSAQNTLTDSFSLEEGKKIYLDLIAAPVLRGTGAVLVLQDKSNHFKILEMGKDFVSNASHELKTPITIVKGFAETLQDLPEISPEMLAVITEKIVRNCQRMENLVKNLLTLTDIENLPETRIKECDLVFLLENCRHILQSIHADAKVDIEKNVEQILITADPELLELAFTNLMNNSVKYSPATAQIQVKIQQMQEEVKIDILDNGIGIPPEDLEHVFDRFYTVNKAHSRRMGGAGLGLSIVKTIVEKHDGSISVQSTLGKGTSFSIVLPIQPCHAIL